jgi:hypothetical protein
VLTNKEPEEYDGKSAQMRAGVKTECGIDSIPLAAAAWIMRDIAVSNQWDAHTVERAGHTMSEITRMAMDGGRSNTEMQLAVIRASGDDSGKRLANRVRKSSRRCGQMQALEELYDSQMSTTAPAAQPTTPAVPATARPGRLRSRQELRHMGDKVGFDQTDVLEIEGIVEQIIEEIGKWEGSIQGAATTAEKEWLLEEAIGGQLNPTNGRPNPPDQLRMSNASRFMLSYHHKQKAQDIAAVIEAVVGEIAEPDVTEYRVLGAAVAALQAHGY